jgi:hypothetical protein
VQPTTTIEDSPAGFAEFYHLLFRRDLPLHAFSWVRQLYAARAEGKGFVIEAFRGSSKTTSISVAFLAFRIGIRPHDSFLVVQATAAAAKQTCLQVADLIANNPGWHVAFPHVVPDKKLGWSMQNGYEVKRDDMDYTQWRQLCAETKGRDRTFVGFGYRSSHIVGLHPTGMLLADDIHNENNTRSTKEMDKAVAIITSNILPTLNPNTWKVFIGTPWRQNDVLQYLKATETYASVSTPIYTELELDQIDSRAGVASDSTDSSSVISSEPELRLFNGAGRREIPLMPIEESPQPETNQPNLQSPLSASDGEGSGVRPPEPAQPDSWLSRELTWPERFTIPIIENYRQMLGEREFARMYLLDLTAAEGIHLKAEWLQKVDSSLIQPAWPIVMGVDYASTADKQRDNDRDYLAIAIGCAQPNRSGIILIDGYRGHLSHAEAEDKLLELAAFYPNTEVIGIESVSKGEEFYQSLSSHPSLPIVEMKPGSQSKGARFQNVMAPLFQRGWARISDKESPFMQSFRREWLRWPWGDHDDTLDAVYWMLFAGQSHLPPRSARSKTPTPFSDLGRN